jgi:hypothetical protein
MERSWSTRAGFAQILIRPDLITTRVDLDPPVLDPSMIWIRPDQIPNGTDLIQSEWIRTDLDPIGSGSGSRPDLDLLLSCGKIFPVAKIIFLIAARFFMSLITICSRAAWSFLSLKLFALLRQDFSSRYIFGHLLQDTVFPRDPP